MRKFLFFLVAFLLVAGMAQAVSLPGSEEGKAGPYVWMEQVYNNSSGTLDVGDVVIWDVEQSTGDNDNYVTTTTTADTYIVAGVVYPADIAAGDQGTIAIRGVVQVDMISGQGVSVDGPVCTSTTAGSARSCDTNAAMFGFITQVASSNSALVYVTK